MILFKGKKIFPKRIKRILLGRYPIWEKEPELQKLSAPVISLYSDDEPSVPSVPGGMTPAILGIAILGKTILGVTSVLPKLETPVISLVEEEAKQKLSAPSIYLSVVEDGEVVEKLKLASPVIRIEEYADGEEPEVPVITKLEAPVISIEVIDDGEEPGEPEEPVITKLSAPQIYLEVVDDSGEEPEEPDEPVVLKLGTPVIRIVEQSEEEPDEPVVLKLSAPVIELYAEEEAEPEVTVTAPTNLRIENETLYWDAAENAEYYKVFFRFDDGIEQTSGTMGGERYTTQFAFGNGWLMQGYGTYEFYVRAYADGGNVISEDSESVSYVYEAEISKLATPIIRLEETHEHSYSETITEPTCTEQGYTTHVCSCGDSYVDSYVAAKGHTEVVDKAVAATCTQSGLTEGKHCSICGEVIAAQEVVPATGHNYGEAYYSDEFGTGYGQKCQNCGNLLELEAPSQPGTGIMGDANNDGIVNAEDVLLIRKYAAHGVDASEINLLNADVNGDGKVNVLDADLVRKMITLEAPVIELFKETEEEPSQGILGDVNDDGVVNADDYELLRKYTTGQIGGEELHLENADMNGDGAINIYDTRILLGMVTLATPVIELFEEAEPEPEPEPEEPSAPKLEAPVIELYIEDEPEPEAPETPEAPVLTLLEGDYLYNEYNGTYDICFAIENVGNMGVCRTTYLDASGNIAVQNEKELKNGSTVNAYSILRLNGCAEGTYSVYAEALANGVYSEKSNIITFEYSEEHDHKYSETVVEPTCTERGYTKHTCACGESYNDSYVAALGHTEVTDAAVDAGCETTGLTEGKHCSVCKEVLTAQQTIPAKGHSFGDAYYSDEFDTGYGQKCSVCGKLQSLENRKLAAPVIEIEEITETKAPVLTISGDVLSWTPVEGAVGYMVLTPTYPGTSFSSILLNNETQYYLVANSVETTVDLTERKADFADGIYTLYVLAPTAEEMMLSNGVAFVCGEVSAPTLSISGNVLSWTEVSGATKYVILTDDSRVGNYIGELGKYEVGKTTATSFDVAEELEGMALGEIALYAAAVLADGSYGDISNSVSYTDT